MYVGILPVSYHGFSQRHTAIPCRAFYRQQYENIFFQCQHVEICCHPHSFNKDLSVFHVPHLNSNFFHFVCLWGLLWIRILLIVRVFSYNQVFAWSTRCFHCLFVKRRVIIQTRARGVFHFRFINVIIPCKNEFQFWFASFNMATYKNKLWIFMSMSHGENISRIMIMVKRTNNASLV